MKRVTVIAVGHDDRNARLQTKKKIGRSLTEIFSGNFSRSPDVGAVTAVSPKFTNRLAREKSPYLLQHAHNPVDWMAWKEEAFEKARRENKPILLSVGYSTCHWCHVMERESFENEKVGAFLNEHFVSIKVDREERPDVDKIYMTFVQATTGSGGWPMNVFLTPDLKPFYGGTYFPPDARYGRPGFLQLIEHIHQLWETRRDDLLHSAAEVHERMEQLAVSDRENSPEPLTPEVLHNAVSQFKQSFDPQNGGFGGAPKFPQPSTPQLLLRCARRFNDDEAVRMVLHTCDRMAAGGIHDHLGGGFARYSVDAEWLVPHFEKMLYDNAQLAQLYLDAYLIEKSEVKNQKSERGNAERYADIVRDILDYVLRDMTHPDGGFYSAEDADSHFGITEPGNFTDHSHPQPLPNQNVLSIVEPSVSGADADLLVSAKRKMIEARSKRIRPHLDDKILASWNGLMLGAFARAFAVLGTDKYLAAAERNLKFLRETLWISESGTIGSSPANGAHRVTRPTGTLFHRWRDGERDDVELLAGYAFLLSGVIELYEATLEPKHLEFALPLAEAMLAKFYDAENGGFWQSAANTKDLIVRVKEDYDGAEPSGNSVAILSLLKLGAITGRKDFQQAAEKSLRLFANRLRQAPQAVPFMLQALDFSMQEPTRVVITGDPSNTTFSELLRAAHSVYHPQKVVLGNTGGVEDFARTLKTQDAATAYVCTGTACQPPTSDAMQLGKLLNV
jgi:uncharacterized protein YyaL (SSP411 family)